MLQSTKQIDLLGEAIRTDTMTPADWKLFFELRSEWQQALTNLELDLDKEFSSREFELTSRLKNFRTLREKLQRSNLKLSSVRDVIGSRLVIPDNQLIQDGLVHEITAKITNDRYKVIDRRVNPNHGYRAVHIELRRDGAICEIQIRTQLQDLWAATSEAFGEIVGRGIRYGEVQDYGRFSPVARAAILDIENGLGNTSRKIGWVNYENLEELNGLKQLVVEINSLISNTDWGLRSWA